jgi:hypothetical protein
MRIKSDLTPGGMDTGGTDTSGLDTSGTDTGLLPVPKRLHARSDFLKLEIQNANPQASIIHHLVERPFDPPTP